MAVPENYKKLGTVGTAYKGEYDPEQEYKYTNTVFYKGSTFIALKDNPVGEPSNDGENWRYLARGFSGEGAVESVNGKTGDVELTADDVNALSINGTAANSIKWNGFSVEILSEEAYQQLVVSATADPLTFYLRPKNSEDMEALEKILQNLLGSDEDAQTVENGKEEP